MDIGEQMLISGAEVHRVEDSISRICRSFGATRVDAFIITSCMILTVHCPDGRTHTQTRRINSLGTDFDRLDKLNQLSRRICGENMSAEEIRAELSVIKAQKRYPSCVQCITYAIISGVFTLFFGGSAIQAIISALIGAAGWLIIRISNSIIENKIFSKFICSFFVTATAFLFVKLGAAAQTDEIIIGNIMYLIPGIAFTNSLRDLFTGDSIAGILQFLEAILGALAIAAGYFLFVFMTGGGAV